MQKTIVKTPTPQDFLALVPQLVGFLPERSLVLVAFRGNRTCGALRFNLPQDQAGVTELRRIAGTLLGTLCKIPGVDALVPVLYTDEEIGDAPAETSAGLPQGAFLRAILARAVQSGFLVRDALCVAADGWASYLDLEQVPGQTAPVLGDRVGRRLRHPLSDIAESSVTEVVPPGDRRELARLQTGAELPKVDLATRERCARRLARYQRLGPDMGPIPELVEMVGDMLDPVGTAETVLGLTPAELSIDEAAVLLFLVQSPATRDQMMLQFAFGEEEGRRSHALNRHYAQRQRETGLSMDDLVAADMAAGRSFHETSPTTGDLMLGLSRQRPDPERVARGIQLLKLLVAMAPRPARPAPLCMLAWLCWALGQGSVAGIYIDTALDIDDDYGMALLLRQVLGSGHLPEWAFEVPREEDA
ncbi:DUF4192 domain-containing protein [Cryobacterium arcticum]|uniref:DUF4192 domain-containing protein n=1 Tax=Cryobacterium arcticum TaxID=670052 RepID=A0A1B1BGV9_9MICO|nr:DUF4192 domain-containing protein [Cryobacterium arcticum]ANP71807.1 hypothetical protein PA27867_0840 [Cryobacterium arcticum]